MSDLIARNCLNRTLSLSLSGFFIYCFLSQHRSMTAIRLNPCSAYEILDRGGVDFHSKTIALYGDLEGTSTFFFHPRLFLCFLSATFFFFFFFHPRLFFFIHEFFFFSSRLFFFHQRLFFKVGTHDGTSPCV